MILDDSPAFPAAFLGAMRIGAVPVPVNPMDRVDNYAYYLDDSYAKVLVVEAVAAGGARVRCSAARRGLHVVASTATPGPHASFDVVRRRADAPELAAADSTRTARTWRSGSTARARPGGPRASCTRTATSR